MNTKEIRKLLGSTIYTRALNYYQNGKVGNIKKGARFYEAKILGSNDSIYDVTIRIDSDGNPYSYFCDCPYGKICKHIGAVLISEFGDNQSDNVQEVSSKKINKHKEKREDRVLPLSNPTSDVSIEIIDILDENEETYHASGLVFEIHREYLKDFGDERYFLRPALLNSKNDEETLSPFFNESKIRKPNSESSNLMKLLKINENLFLSDFMPYIENNDVSVYFELGSKVHLVEFQKIKKIDISFDFFSLFHQEPQFNPVFDIELENGNIVNIKKIHNGIEINGLSVLFLHKKGDLYYSLYDGNLAALLKVFKDKVGLNYEDILYLNNFVNQNLSDKVKLNFDYKIVKLVYPTPFAVIKLEWIFQRLKVSVFFNYNGSEFIFDGKDGYVKLSSENKEELEIAVKNRGFEVEIFNYLEMLFTRFMDFSKQGNLKDKRAGVQFVLKLRVEEFLIKFGAELLENGIKVITDGGATEISDREGKVKFEIKTVSDWLEVKPVYENSKGKLLDLQIDSELLEGNIVKVGDGYTVLTQEEKEKLENILKLSEGDSSKIKVKKLHYSLIDSLYSDLVKSSTKDIKRLKKIFENLNDYSGIENYQLPKGFRGDLRDYQISGYNWLYFLRSYGINGILADDMGLGKTVQTLALLQKVKEEQKKLSVLLVVPVTTMFNWEIEIKKFTPELSFTRHAGAKRNKDENELFRSDILLVSYQTLRIDIEFFKSVNFDYIILDEAQYVKNPNSQVFKAVKVLNSKHRISLSGTPVENSTIELWSQMDFLNPGVLGTLKQFKMFFVKPIEKDGNVELIKRLQKIVFPFILRRKKEDVLKDLPEKEEVVLYSEMGKKQEAIYNEYKSGVRQRLEKTLDEKGVNRSAIEIFDALLRLRQISLFPELVDESFKGYESAKFELLKEMVGEIIQEDHKIIIFSQFVKSLKIMKSYFDNQNIDYSYIDGSTKNRQSEVEKFQNGDKRKVFLISLKAGSVGINLTAADYVFLFDPWWNPAVEAQAIDRSHRMGQKNKVFAYKMIVKNTVEEKILELQESKKQLVNELITEDKNFFKSLSRKDVLNLFE